MDGLDAYKGNKNTFIYLLYEILCTLIILALNQLLFSTRYEGFQDTFGKTFFHVEAHSQSVDFRYEFTLY